MSEIRWTDAELAEFDAITSGLSSLHQMDRIGSRLDLNAFVKKHGKEKCDAMFAVLKAADHTASMEAAAPGYGERRKALKP